MSKIPCYYTLGGLNFKNGFVTSCPIQSDHLHIIDGQLPSEFWNNDQFKQHRKDMMSGKWCAGCHLCKEAEDLNSTKSMRQDYPADETYYDPSTGAVDFKGLKHVELRFSNSCNMACMHCSEVYSSGWTSKLKKYKPTEDESLEDHKHKLDQLTGAMHRKSLDEDLNIDLSMGEMERIVEDLNTNFPNIEKIDFAGGEVLHQKQFFPCLERLAKHPNAKNLLLTFHTNFNARFDPIRLSKLLEPFGRTTIKMSLDAGRNIYSYFRDGSWNKLRSNIETFKSVNNFSDLEIICTTSVYQVMDLPNIIKSFFELDVKIIESSIVFTPQYLNPAIMMFEFKHEVLQDIAECRRIIKQERDKRRKNFEVYKHRRSYLSGNNEWEDIRSAEESIDRIIKYMVNHKPKYEHWEAFKVYRRKIDRLFNKQFNNAMKYYQVDDHGNFYRSKSVTFTDKLIDLYREHPYFESFDSREKSKIVSEEVDKQIEFYNTLLNKFNPFLKKEVDKNILGELNEDLVKIIKECRLHIDEETKEQLNVYDDLMDNYEGDDRKFFRYDKLKAEVEIVKEWLRFSIRKEQQRRLSQFELNLLRTGLNTHIVDGVVIPLNPNWKRIAVNVSGGADSACLTSILASLIKEHNYDIKIDIITHCRVWNLRPWAGPVAEQVYNKLKETWGDIIGERLTNFIPTDLEHGVIGFLPQLGLNEKGEPFKSGDNTIVQGFNDFLGSTKGYDAIYNATTKNPSVNEEIQDRMLNRDIDIDSTTSVKRMAQAMNIGYWMLSPLRLIEKDWVIKQYYDMDLLDLLKTTRSCEGNQGGMDKLEGFDVHWYSPDKDVPECGECFWCKERDWAIEKEQKRRANEL